MRTIVTRTLASVLAALLAVSCGTVRQSRRPDIEQHVFLPRAPRAVASPVVDEMERSLEDALSVVAVAVEDGRYLTGGGSAEMELAQGLKEVAPSVGGREQLAVEAFANAMEVIPRTLAQNAGMDPIDTLIELRQAHKAGKTTVGVDPLAGKNAELKRLGILEPLRVLKQAVASATDAAVMILRIDDVIASKSPKAGRGMGKGAGAEESSHEFD